MSIDRRHASPPTLTALAASLALALAAGLAGCSRDAPTGRDAPSHRRMLQALRAVAERDAATEARYLEEGAQRLASLPADAPAEVRLRLHRDFGNFLLIVGRNDEAVRHLDAARELLPKAGAALSRDEYVKTMIDAAVGQLRIAETENCVHCETGESCIFPIQPGGVHVKKEGSRGAVARLEELLRVDPRNLKARWLLNVAYMTLGEYPDKVPAEYRIEPSRFASQEPFPRFRNVAKQLGLDSLNMSGGAICDDFDGDGDLDIVTSNWGGAGQLLFFRNEGDGTFVERGEAAGLTGIFGGLNLLQADYDNDGDLDVLVLRGAWLGEDGRLPNSLLRNDGRGTFTDVSYDAGIAGADFPTQTASWGDYDLDGALDLYVGNENQPCQLFHNNGDGTFTDVAAAAGVTNGGFTKGVIWGDYDGDRDPDLYVSNYESVNRLYRNNGDGTFTDVAAQVGVSRPVRSFPVWFWDFDNDGTLDLWVGSSWWDVTHLAESVLGAPSEAELACLYRGTGEGRFREVAESVNLRRLTMPMGCNFGDIDNDGSLDFYLGTGYPEFDGLMPNVLYHNRAGASFADVTSDAGLGHLQKGHGISFADLDNDGDADVFSQMGGAYRADAFRNALYENPGFGNHWLKVRLVGTRSNRYGVGSRLRAEIVESGARRSIYRHVNSGGSFGANPLRQELGLGKAAKVDVLEVFWPASNTTQTFRDVAVDQAIEITEGEATYRPIALRAFRFAGG